MTDPLEKMAQGVAADPFFLASALACYAATEALDETALADKLSCSAETLTLLRLCRNPTPEPPRFWQDVKQIAERFGVDATLLAEIVRSGQSVWKLQENKPSASTEAGFLMAARDADALEGPT